MKYLKKPVEIEAFKWTGGPDQEEDPVWCVKAIKSGKIKIVTGKNLRMEIKTLEGTMKAFPGDYILRGVEGEIYPCKASIFEKTYTREVPMYVEMHGPQRMHHIIARNPNPGKEESFECRTEDDALKALKFLKGEL